MGLFKKNAAKRHTSDASADRGPGPVSVVDIYGAFEADHRIPPSRSNPGRGAEAIILPSSDRGAQDPSAIRQRVRARGEIHHQRHNRHVYITVAPPSILVRLSVGG
jgi:hypothetical protein